MPHYAALDVSNAETAIHIIDETGRTVWRGKRASDPEALAAALRRHAPELVRVGLETGFLTPWLYHGLKALGLPVICLEARHARASIGRRWAKVLHSLISETGHGLERLGCGRNSPSATVIDLVQARECGAKVPPR